MSRETTVSLFDRKEADQTIDYEYNEIEHKTLTEYFRVGKSSIQIQTPDSQGLDSSLIKE